MPCSNNDIQYEENNIIFVDYFGLVIECVR